MTRPHQPIAFLIPGDLRIRTGGYGYDRQIVDGLRRLGWTVDVHALDESFPFPSKSARAAALDLFNKLPAGRTVVVDGLAFGALGPEATVVRDRLQLVALVHHPLAAETGLPKESARALAQ